MKIICDNCRTKYSIADEKVKGKVFKIRCKKCQNIIVVRGNEGAGAAESSPAAEESSGAEAAGEVQVWHLVIGREQVGPMTPAEIRDRFARGEIDSDTYIWREGFADWMRLSAVEDFADIAQSTAVAPQPVGPAAYASPAAAWSAPAEPAAPAAWQAPQEEQAWRAPQTDDTARADSAGLFGGSLNDPGKDLFGSQSGHESTGDFAPAVAPSSDLFRAPAPAQGQGGGDIFSAVGGNGGQQLFPAEDKQGGGGSAQMTGQRHENSVLFSLTNLQALAMGGKPAPSAAAPVAGAGAGDGSGLIDIRAMASGPAKASAPSSGLDDLPDLGGYSAPLAAAPVLLPAVVDERPRWVLPVIIGVGATLVLSVVALTIVLVLRKPEVQVQQVATNVPQPGTAATKPETKIETKAETKDAKDTKAETKPEDDGAAAKKVAVRKGKGKGKKGKGGGVRVAAADPVSPAASPAGGGRTTKGSGKKRDDLDALIDGAIGSGGKKAAPKPKAASPAADANLPETLGRDQIVSGMKSVKGRVQGCFDKYRVPGQALVTVTIAKSGAVTSAKVKGIFAGTPTGACIQAAVRSATFSRFRGSAVTFDYPFLLR